MKPLPRILMIIFCFGCFALPARAQEQAAAKLVLILDASGSMWGQINGENKIVIARRAVKEVVGGLAYDTEVALLAYGHRRKADCEDIETLVPFGPIDKQALGESIDALNPKGKTPITAAVQQAFDLLRSQHGSATIVLVSDGLETCGGDPCQLVRETRQAGLKFVMHVIGFDVGEEDVSQLECAAQTGGGLYFNAKDAGELASALGYTVTAPPEMPGGRLSVKAVADGKLTDVVVNVVDAKTGKQAASGRTYTDPGTNPRLLPLPPGIYNVEIDAVGFKGKIRRTFEELEIGASDTVKKVVDFSTGELAVEVTRNGELSDATVNIYVAGTREHVAGGRTYTSARSNPAVYRVTPGEYDVVLKSVEIANRPEKRLQKVSVRSGSRAQHSVAFASGTLHVGATMAGELIDVTLNIVDLETGKPVVRGRTYTSPKTNPKSYELLPGRYRITLKPVKHRDIATKTIEVAVDGSKSVERMVSFAE